MKRRFIICMLQNAIDILSLGQSPTVSKSPDIPQYEKNNIPSVEQSIPSDFPSLEVLHEEIKDRVSLQLSHADSLDTKSGLVLASSGLLTAALASLRDSARDAIQANPSMRWSLCSHDISPMNAVNIITIATLVLFVAVVSCAYHAYGLQKFEITPEPLEQRSNLIRDWLKKPSAQTRQVLTGNRVTKDLPRNECLLQKKIKWTRWSLRSLLAQSVLLLIMALIQALL